MQNKKKSYMITAVMKMRTYQTIDRLQSSQYIGQQHVAVKQHRMKSYPQHWHNYFEIELVLSGSGVQTYNGKEYPIARGDVYLLTPVDFHGIEGDVELLNISFDEVCLPRDMLSFLSDPKSEKISRLSAEEFDRFCMAAALLQHECQVSGTCTGQLLEYLLCCFARRTKMQREHLPNEQLSGMQKAISFIELHFREPVTLKQLSALSGYNASYFSELFHKVTGQTYKERIRQLRISYAKMLLTNGCSVSETCFASGFGSLSNFTATFREQCGIAPKDYQKTVPKE